MGTRALVKVIDRSFEREALLLTLYRQNDGYPTGLGDELKRILHHGGSTIVSGIRGERCPRHFNGAGCLAAWLVKELKDDIGRTYIYPADASDEAFTYELHVEHGKPIFLKARSSYRDWTYEGLLRDFDGAEQEELADREED